MTNKVYTKVAIIKKDITKLLKETCITIALLLDKWQSNNKKKFLAINSFQLKLNIKFYRVYLMFIKIIGLTFNENLAIAIYKISKRLNILDKIIIITGDNALNNDILS